MPRSKAYVALEHVIWKNNKGEIHRKYGPAVVAANGTKEWLLNGELHREDGPAVEFADGSKEWYLNGKLHREDGPAIDWQVGIKEWYLKGVSYTKEDYNEQLKTLR